MKKIAIVGAGLVGAALSMMLARRGYAVELYDRIADIRRGGSPSRRSINLTLCSRGFRALDFIGVGDIVRKICVPVYGRMIHNPQGRVDFQPYGNHEEAIYSVERERLSGALLDCAEHTFEIPIHFNQKCLGLNLSDMTLEFRDLLTGERSTRRADVVIGGDGVHSTIRQQLQRGMRMDFSQKYSDQGYKELHIPRRAAGEWGGERGGLHIWPRGDFMVIAFPNLDGGLTCSLQMPYEGRVSFASLRNADDVSTLFRNSFPDLSPKLPDLIEEFFSAPPNPMLTIKCSPWSYQGRAAVIGDAAHSILPSYGQGANAGFEDCLTLDQCLESCDGDFEQAFREYERLRKPNTDTIADLCVEHFFELRDHVGSPDFLLRKKIERKMNQLFPTRYMDLYSLISFTNMSYVEALKRERAQRAMIEKIVRIRDIEHRLESKEIEAVLSQFISANPQEFPNAN